MILSPSFTAMTTTFTLRLTDAASRFAAMSLVNLASSGLQGGRCEFGGRDYPKHAEVTGSYGPWSTDAQRSEKQDNRLHHNSLFSTVRDNWEMPQA